MVAKKHETQTPLVDEQGGFFDPSLDPDRFEGIHIVTTLEEAWERFDQDARRELGLSGEEFLRRWDNGEYRDIEDDREGRKVMRAAFLIPVVRPQRG